MESVNPGGWICDVTYEQAALAHGGEACPSSEILRQEAS